MAQGTDEILLRIPTATAAIEGMLAVPAAAAGVVVFAHGSGSGRYSPRNTFVAEALREAGLATLLLDLLTPAEDADRALRFDIELLTGRLVVTLRHLAEQPAASHLPVGVFGASTGAAAALRLAAAEPEHVRAVVSRGGRPDLAEEEILARVRAPTLLIVGGSDTGVLGLNQAAYRALRCEKALEIVPGATHLFEEPGTLGQVAKLAADWFLGHLGSRT